jgi:hypothetical protein
LFTGYERKEAITSAFNVFSKHPSRPASMKACCCVSEVEEITPIMLLFTPKAHSSFVANQKNGDLRSIPIY